MSAAGLKLTAKQLAFCREYCIDQNGTDAAIRAGFSKNRPAAQAYASRLLDKPNVAAEIARRTAKVEAKAEITLQTIVEQLMEDREYARTVRNASAAVAASMGLAKVTGHLVEDRKNAKGPLQDFTTAQLTELEESLARFATAEAASRTAH